MQGYIILSISIFSLIVDYLMGAKVDIPSIGRCQYMQWNVQIGVGNLYTELFVTDILIHS